MHITNVCTCTQYNSTVSWCMNITCTAQQQKFAGRIFPIEVTSPYKCFHYTVLPYTAHTHTYTHTPTHTHTHTLTHTHTHTCTHTHVHIHTHTNAHAHTHTQTHIPRWLVVCLGGGRRREGGGLRVVRLLKAWIHSHLERNTHTIYTPETTQ